MEFSIAPIAEEHIGQFHAALTSVVRERRYLAFLEPPPLEGCAAFVRANIRAGVPQFVALATPFAWTAITRTTSQWHCRWTRRR